MTKNAKSNYSIYVAVVCVVVAIVGLWWMVGKSASIPFVYRQKELASFVLTYALLSMLVTWMVLRNDLTYKGWTRTSKREHWMVVGFAVITPVLLANVLILLFPFIGNSQSGEVVKEEFIYVSTEPYARTSRGLVRLKLVDDKGREHWVIFKKERVEKLAMECGDLLTTLGRKSFLGYVIDSEAKTKIVVKRCPEG